MVRVQSMIVLVHRTIQQVLWIISHELSDPGQAKKSILSIPLLTQTSVCSIHNEHWVALCDFIPRAPAKIKVKVKALEEPSQCVKSFLIFTQTGTLTFHRSTWTSCPSYGGWEKSWCQEGPQCWRDVGWDHRSEPGRGLGAPCARWRSPRWGCHVHAHDQSSGAPREQHLVL